MELSAARYPGLMSVGRNTVPHATAGISYVARNTTIATAVSVPRAAATSRYIACSTPATGTALSQREQFPIACARVGAPRCQHGSGDGQRGGDKHVRRETRARPACGRRRLQQPHRRAPRVDECEKRVQDAVEQKEHAQRGGRALRRDARNGGALC
eukprot:6188106-Pleurochrysis_carterae.AAC.3